MANYEFTLILKDLPAMTEEASNALFEAGCDDGTPGSSQGVSRIAFDREAQHLEAAIRSAVRDVRRAGFEVERVQLDDQELSALFAIGKAEHAAAEAEG
ncbi:MAG: hypothetical protein ACREJB_04605 [Planctomycetaceae bacterium]